MKRNLQKQLAGIVCLSLAMLFGIFSASAQQTYSVSGVVVDDGNQAVIGATVALKDDTRIGTVTDATGSFEIYVPEGSTLIVSFIGMGTQEVPVGTRTSLTVKLLSDSQEIEEVVVVGYGQQKKASVVGSIATTKGEDLLTQGGVTSVSSALQGQMAGVVSISSTSQPGEEDTSIFIRGKSSTTDNTPLYLVDGVERSIDDIDMNEVESISVLKDASATAVYGVKGANGVILVTTRRGTTSKAKVSFSSNFGFKKLTTDLDYADYVTTMNMYNEAAANDLMWDNLIPESEIAAWENAYATGNYGPYNDIFPEVDWIDECTKDFGFSHNYNVNVSGGTERMKYFASLGYLFDGDVYETYKQEDYDPRYYYRRYNWRTNFDYNVTSSTVVSVNIAGSQGYQNQPFAQSNSDAYLFNKYYCRAMNEYPIKYSDGVWGSSDAGSENSVAELNYMGQTTYKTFKGMYDLAITQDLGMITKGLTASAKLSYTATTKNSSTYQTGGFLNYNRKYDYTSEILDEDGNVTYEMTSETRYPTDYPLVGEAMASVAYNTYVSSSRQTYYEARVSYVREFNEMHDVTALALFNRNKAQSGVSFPSYEEDWVGRLTYGYKERYLAEFNAAYTGSEKFAPGHRFGFFPSFSAGWRLTEEPWMKAIKDKWLSNFKIRYSWGKVGSDSGADRFNYIQTYEASSNVIFGGNSSTTTDTLYYEGTMANEAATWEEAVKQNLGIEMSFFKKLSLMVDLFDEQRTGILTTLTNTASWIGVDLPSDNIGSTKNHGIEVEARWNDKIGKDFRYNIGFTFGTSENRIVYADDPLDSDWYSKDEGKSIGYTSKYICTGNFSSLSDVFNAAPSGLTTTAETIIPGDLMYVDYNSDGQVSSDDMVPSEYSSYPMTTYSLTLGFNYKNLGLSALFYAATDVYKDEIDYLLYDFPASELMTQVDVLDRWTYADAESTEIVRPSIHLSSYAWNKLDSNYNYTDHSYLRLKNLEINYVLPAKWTKKAYISRCQVYANGTNLITWQRNDSRRDPETNSQSVYPLVKRYNVGLRITFQ
ncbi:MAG: TonB-dependent receptor [Rikenellaceae bacterium]